MQDSTNEKRIMRRRGRPRKSEMDSSPVRKPRALRMSDEEEKYIASNAQRCKMNFSEYCRKVLMNYKPSVPDTKFRDELIAARRDIVNFANNLKGMHMTKDEKKKLLESTSVIRKWANNLVPLIEFLDKMIERV